MLTTLHPRIPATFFDESLRTDFIEKLEQAGGVASSVPLPRAAATYFHAGTITPTIEVKINRDRWYSFGRSFLNGAFPFVEELLLKTDELLGLGGFLFDYEKSFFTLRFVPQALFMSASIYFGGNAPVLGEPTCGLSLLSEVRDLFSDDKRPVNLDTVPYQVHGKGPVLPYIGALHDWLHILRSTRVPQPFRRDQVLLFDAASAIPQKISRGEEVLEAFLDGPSQDQLEGFSGYLFYQHLFRLVNAYLAPVDVSKPERDFAVSFGRELLTRLEGHPRREMMLGAYSWEIYRKWVFDSVTENSLNSFR